MDAEIKTRILDLPDDCLIPIFENLSFSDLLSVFESHKYFQVAAKQSFSLNYKTIRIQQYRSRNDYIINESSELVNRLNLTNIFETFGTCIKSLQLQSNLGSNMTSLLYLVNNYCSESLKRLSLNCSMIDGRKINDFIDLFKHLEALEVVSGIDNDTFEKILIYCENLRDLIVNVENLRLESFLPKIHSKLERIFYRLNKRDISMQNVINFLQRHPNLKVLNISKLFLATSECLNYLANVELLRVDLRSKHADLSRTDWNRLFQLEHLKRLDLFFNQDISDSLMKVPSKPPSNLEILALNVNYLKNVFDLLDTFTFNNLKILTISCLSSEKKYFGVIDPIVIKSVIKKLPNLEEIQFFYFRDEAFENLLQIVKASNSLKTVVLLRRDVSDSNFSHLMEFISCKEKEMKLETPRKVVIGAHSGEIWRHDYFYMHF